MFCCCVVGNGDGDDDDDDDVNSRFSLLPVQTSNEIELVAVRRLKKMPLHLISPNQTWILQFDLRFECIEKRRNIFHFYSKHST